MRRSRRGQDPGRRLASQAVDEEPDHLLRPAVHGRRGLEPRAGRRGRPARCGRRLRLRAVLRPFRRCLPAQRRGRRREGPRPPGKAPAPRRLRQAIPAGSPCHSGGPCRGRDLPILPAGDILRLGGAQLCGADGRLLCGAQEGGPGRRIRHRGGLCPKGRGGRRGAGGAHLAMAVHLHGPWVPWSSRWESAGASLSRPGTARGSSATAFADIRCA